MTEQHRRSRQVIELLAGGNRFSPLLRLALLSLLSLALLLTGTLLWRQKHSVEQAYPGPFQDLPVALNYDLGVNADLEQYESEALEQTLTLMEEAGFGWVRQTFPWAEIEPQPGRFEWARWDAIIESVSDHDLRLIAVLDSAPAWSQIDPAKPHPGAPPHEMADFGSFARAFALRYGQVVDFYQIWDEPNLSEHWGGVYVDPAAYGQLLREASIQIRNADPSATLILAGLAPTVEQGPLNLNEASFLEGVYAVAGAPFFDIAAAKPYGFWHRAGDPQIDPRILNFGRLQLLRRVMEAHGDSAKPLWAVAFGWNALPEGWTGRPSAWGTDTEATQAADTIAAIERARREWPWLGLMTLSHWQPDLLSDDPFIGFSLLDEKGQPRPVLNAIRDMASAAPVAWAGNYHPDHPSAQYTGNWRVTSAGADIPPAIEDESADGVLIIRFYGTRLDLILRRGEYWGILDVTIDGQPANRLPQDARGRSYLVLYDPLHETATLPLASGLTEDFHTATIAPTGGWGQWAIAGWNVTSEPDLRPYQTALIALSVALILSLAAAILCLYRARSALSALFSSIAAHYHSLADEFQLALLALAAALFYFVPGLLPGLAALFLLALLIYLRPDHGLALVGFSIPFFLRPKLLAGRAFSPVEISLMLCFIAWAARKVHNLRRPLDDIRCAVRKMQSADWAIAALVGLGAASLAWAENFGVASREFRVVILEAGIFYLLLRGQPASVHRRVADALVAGAVLTSAIGVGQYFLSADLVTAEGVRRVRALYGSPNNLALFLERILPLMAVMALWSSNRKRRAIYALALLPVLAALFLTFSKGALFLGLPAALFFLGLVRGRRAMGLALIALLVLALVLLPFIGTERFAGTFDLTGGTAFFRIKLWQSSLKMIADHPLTGVGLDNFLYAYRTRYVLPEASDELNLSHPHNILLDFWTRLGLGGAILLIFLVLIFFKQGFQAYRQLPDGEDRFLHLGLLGGMVAALAHGLVDNAFFLVDLAFIFMLALAVLQTIEPEEIDV